MTKPTGNFKCRVCGNVWGGEQLYQDPAETATVWTCQCGGTCDRIRMTRLDKYSEAGAHIGRTAGDPAQAMVLGAFYKDWIDHEEDQP